MSLVAIVELDDRTHLAAADVRRDAYTASAGIRTLRFESKNKISQMTPIAAKLYEFVASRQLPAVLELNQFRLLCGVEEGSVGAWQHEVKRACRELVSNGVAGKAWVDGDSIRFQK